MPADRLLVDAGRHAIAGAGTAWSARACCPRPTAVARTGSRPAARASRSWGLIDDATGRVTGARFRDQEDTAGYLEVLGDTLRDHGVPGAIHHDRHAIFEVPFKSPLTLEEQLLGARIPTQLGRALAELGIGSVSARSPQAKGRIERLWGTLQDRLVSELRPAGVDERDGANAFLVDWLPAGTPIERICCFKYRRTVARDGTVRARATVLQLSSGRRGSTCSILPPVSDSRRRAICPPVVICCVPGTWPTRATSNR